MSYRFFHLHKEDSVGCIRIDRPPVNAFDLEAMQEFGALIENVGADRDIRVVMISGSTKVFSAGADINMLNSSEDDYLIGFLELCQQTLRKVEMLAKIVIAAIEGHCVGGGLELALACDFRFMAQGENKICLAEIRIGVITAWGTTYRLPRLIGKSKALDLIITGRLLDAEEAQKIGLVDRIFPPGDIMSKTLEYAKDIAKGAPVAIGMAKKCINEGMDKDFSEVIRLERESQMRLFNTRDFKEGVRAFLEKKTAEFKGK